MGFDMETLKSSVMVPGNNKGIDMCLFGLPGSGKSTLAKFLEQYLISNYPDTTVAFVSVGDIARSLSEETRKTGAYAPEDELRVAVAEVVKMYHDSGWRVCLEGIPRSFSQMVFVHSILTDPMYVHLTTPGITCIDRLLKRGRQDDTVDGIVSRIEITQALTEQIVKYLAWSPRYKQLDGTLRFDNLIAHDLVWSLGWRD